MRDTLQPRLQVVADVLEDRCDLWAKENERADNHDGNERDDKRVLDETLSTITAKQAVQHDDVPPLKKSNSCDALLVTEHTVSPHLRATPTFHLKRDGVCYRS